MEKVGFTGSSKDFDIDVLHNQDKVIKEALEIFKGKTLEFLDEKLDGEIVDVLSSEITETTTKKAYSENAYKLSTNEGLHVEWEAGISKDDLMRFASYNIDLSRKHKIPFVTVIVTAKPHGIKRYCNPSLTFTPRIINLKGRDADSALNQIEEKLSKGEPVNELQLIYLPLYSSKSGKTVAELLAQAMKLTPRVAKGVFELNKLQSLLVLLCGSIVKKEDMGKILEENMFKIQGNSFLEILKERTLEAMEQGHERGLEQGLEQGLEKGLEQGLERGLEQGVANVAKKMIKRNDDFSLISELTGLSMQKLNELKAELNNVPSDFVASGRT